MSRVKNFIRDIDSEVANYGYDGGEYGMVPARAAKPAITANPAIQQKIGGTSTFQITVSVTKTGNGSGNSINPVFLFGGDALSNTANGYTAIKVASPIQKTSTSFVNGKNVINFRYENAVEPNANYSVYSVSLTTDGEYPFILNSLSGKNRMMVRGIQMEISDSAQANQLKQSIQSFVLTEFGKSQTNDLTTPRDLYQFQSDGVFFPHQFPISGREGMLTNVLEVNNFSVTYFFYVEKAAGCGC